MTATCPHQDCRGLCFSQEIRDNRVMDTLFQVVSCTNVAIKGGRITVNQFKKLSEPEEAVATDDVVISENTQPPEDTPDTTIEPEMIPNLPGPG